MDEGLSAARRVAGGAIAVQPQEQPGSNHLVVGADAAESGENRRAGAKRPRTPRRSDRRFRALRQQYQARVIGRTRYACAYKRNWIGSQYCHILRIYCWGFTPGVILTNRLHLDCAFQISCIYRIRNYLHFCLSAAIMAYHITCCCKIDPHIARINRVGSTSTAQSIL